MLLGDALKEFREYRGLTTEEISKNICSVDELLKYESGNAHPDLRVTTLLAERLNLPISNLFNVALDNYSTSVIQLIEKYKGERNYNAIYQIVQKEIESLSFDSTLLKQYLKWHEGICIYYIDQNLKRAIDVLSEAIAITNPDRINLYEREIEILNSMAILLYEIEDFKGALSLYLEAHANLEKLPKILNLKVKIKVLFGLAQTYTELRMYEESLSVCEKGIRLCINEETLYCLNEFHFQSGENYVKLGELQEGKKYLDECLYLLKLEQKYDLLEIMEDEVKNLMAESNY